MDFKNLSALPNSALVIAGPDGITADICGLWRFLKSPAHQFSVQLFFFGEEKLLLATISDITSILRST